MPCAPPRLPDVSEKSRKISFDGKAHLRFTHTTHTHRIHITYEPYIQSGISVQVMVRVVPHPTTSAPTLVTTIALDTGPEYPLSVPYGDT